MPLRPELRKFYGKYWREVVRPRILARAKDRCEQCRVPNYLIIARFNAYPGWWFTMDGEIHRADGTLEGMFRGSEMPPPDRLVRIILTVAHLDHQSGHDDDQNLKALCQWCHLNYDQAHHKETRSRRKDASRPLLKEVA